MNGFEMSEGKVRVDLGCGDVGMPEHHLHAAQVGTVLNHVSGATVSQTVWAGGAVGAFNEIPDPLSRERHSAKRQKKASAILAGGPALVRGADAVEMRAAFAQILLQSLDSSSAKRNDSLFVAFAADLHATGVESEVAGVERGDFRDAEAPCIQKFENRAIAEGGGLRLGMRGGLAGTLEHLDDFRLGKRLGQYLPCLGRLDVHGRIVMNAAVEKQPLVKAAQATQLTGYGTRVNAVVAQMLEQSSDVGLGGFEKHGIAALEKLREDVQVTEIGLASKRTKSFLYAKIGLIFI